ncbi:LysR family transcriptional regulator [Spartinivicinus ruber]|uniref:LysR family transcriptional regulator n=1 Tax=Spartinivicinus ruber TaxID=2683272 RepID=UPI0013D2B48D|nr:LysR family transcriptional regulator [Spartinivicinus ruber]
MNLSKIDLNLFVVFDAIYSEANLTRAGHILGITQPAVSNALARLRETFNDPLFIRTSQGMVPTPMAQNIIGQVREALTLLRTSIQHCDSFDPTEADKLFRLSIGDLNEAILLPRLLTKLQEIAPNLNIETQPISPRETTKELASGRLDFAIDAPVNYDIQIKHQKLFEDNYVCVVREDHPVLGNGGLSLDHYLELNHIQILPRFGQADEVDIVLGRLGIQRRVVFTAQHYLVAPLIVRKSDLAMTVPERFARAQHDIRILPLPFEDFPTMEVHLYWHESSNEDASNVWMRRCILELCHEIEHQPII